MEITEEQVREAEARMQRRLSETPLAREAYFDGTSIVVVLSDGNRFMFRPEQAQDLEGAEPAQLRQIEISPAGDGMYFPALDADLSVPALLHGVFGSKAWMRSNGRPQT